MRVLLLCLIALLLLATGAGCKAFLALRLARAAEMALGTSGPQLELVQAQCTRFQGIGAGVQCAGTVRNITQGTLKDIKVVVIVADDQGAERGQYAKLLPAAIEPGQAVYWSLTGRPTEFVKYRLTFRQDGREIAYRRTDEQTPGAGPGASPTLPPTATPTLPPTATPMPIPVSVKGQAVFIVPRFRDEIAAVGHCVTLFQPSAVTSTPTSSGLVSTEVRIVADTLTDNSGNYEFRGILPGRYDIHVQEGAPGPCLTFLRVVLRDATVFVREGEVSTVRIEKDLRLLVHTPQVSGSQVTFRWDAYPHATGYVVRILAVAGHPSSWQHIMASPRVAGTTATLTGLEPGKYNGQVDAYGPDGALITTGSTSDFVIR